MWINLELRRSSVQMYVPLIKKSVYKELGGFVPRAIFNEDMILAGTMIKAGYGIAYAADAKVIHSHNYSGRQQFHRILILQFRRRSSGDFCWDLIRERGNPPCDFNSQIFAEK